MSQRTRLFCLKDPYDLPASDAQFIRAVRENCSFHYTHCLEYRRLLDSFAFRPNMLNDCADLARLPFLPTATFKHHRLFSLPRRPCPHLRALQDSSARSALIIPPCGVTGICYGKSAAAGDSSLPCRRIILYWVTSFGGATAPQWPARLLEQRF